MGTNEITWTITTVVYIWTAMGTYGLTVLEKKKNRKHRGTLAKYYGCQHYNSYIYQK
jgi:hypothetical protein